MKQEIRILFTSVGRRVELIQMYRAAAENLGKKLVIYGADIVSTAPALSVCDRTVLVPRISNENYIPELLRICREEKIDALIPTIDTDLLLLSTKKEDFAAVGTRAIISRTEKIAICRDKRYTADYFNSVGLLSPHPVDNITDYNSGFPAFIKPKDGSSSIGAHKIENEEELTAYSKEVPDYIVQPFISGTEYTVDAFCDFDGNPVFITPRIRLAVRAGEVLKTKIVQDEQIIEEMKRLLADFRPCGPITVQLIRNDATGEDWYIEINPRYGGGAPLSMKAGAASAEAMLKLLSGEQVEYMPHAAADGAVYSRFDQCVCTDPGAFTPGSISAVIFDLDDTLYNELDYVKSGYKEVAAVIPEVERAAEKLTAAFEKGLPAIDAVLECEGIADPKIKARCIAAYRNQMPDIRLADETKELLEYIRAKGIKIGIITDGRSVSQRNKISVLGLENLVDEIIVTDELGGLQFRKPNDIAFRIMKYRLNVPYEKMIYVGDNGLKDFQAPKALGMKYAYYKNPLSIYGSKEIYAPVTITDLRELKKLL